MGKILKRGAYIFGVLILILLFIRIITPTEIDDVHPNIECGGIQKYNPDVLWVIPLYEGVGISNNQEWCREILSLNKTLGMHGVYHKYREFSQIKFTEYLNEGMDEFEKCFGYKPETFKPPQLRINLQNKKILKENNLIVKNKFNQVTHKVYHCDGMSKIPNWIIHIL